MVISDISSASDEVSDLAALILPTFDTRIDNLLASFDHLAREMSSWLFLMPYLTKTPSRYL